MRPTLKKTIQLTLSVAAIVPIGALVASPRVMPTSVHSHHGASNDHRPSRIMNRPASPESGIVNVTSYFDRATIQPHGTTILTVEFDNRKGESDATLTSDWTISLPAGVYVASPAQTTCAGYAIDAAGGNDFTMTHGTRVPAGHDCMAWLSVSSDAVSVYGIVIPSANFDTGSTLPLTAMLSVSSDPLPPAVVAGFVPHSTFAGHDARWVVTLNNPNAWPLTVTDTFNMTLPAGLHVSSDPRTTCASGNVTANPDHSGVSLASGVDLAEWGSCNVSFVVTAETAGDYLSTVPAGSLHTTAGSNPDAATSPLRVNDAMSARVDVRLSSAVAEGEFANRLRRLIVTLDNTTGDQDSVLVEDLVVALPASVSIASMPDGTCMRTTLDGWVEDVAGGDRLTIQPGVAIPAHASCSFWVDVFGAEPGDYVLSVPAEALRTQTGRNETSATTTLSFDD